MQSEKIEEIIINKLNDCLGNVCKDYVVKESTDIPFLLLTIEMTLYNYFVARVVVEKGTIFLSIVQSGFVFELCKRRFSEEELKEVLLDFDKEVRLRIPDKYLDAKGL